LERKEAIGKNVTFGISNYSDWRSVLVIVLASELIEKVKGKR